MSDERNLMVFVCPHLRPVVRDHEDTRQWVHVMEDGASGSRCEASVHRAFIPLPRAATALANQVLDR